MKPDAGIKIANYLNGGVSQAGRINLDKHGNQAEN
jgi:hypothetical protein